MFVGLGQLWEYGNVCVWGMYIVYGYVSLFMGVWMCQQIFKDEEIQREDIEIIIIAIVEWAGLIFLIIFFLQWICFQAFVCFHVFQYM